MKKYFKLIRRLIFVIIVAVFCVVISIPVYTYWRGQDLVRVYLDPPVTLVSEAILVEYKNWLGRPLDTDYRKLNPYSYLYYLFKYSSANKSTRNELSDVRLYSTASRQRFLEQQVPGYWHVSSAVAAIYVSRNWTIDQIISDLIDNSYFGNRIFDLEEASNYYFGVEVDQLKKAQLYSLFHISIAPSTFNLWCNPNEFKHSLESALRKRGVEYILPRLKLREDPSQIC